MSPKFSENLEYISKTKSFNVEAKFLIIFNNQLKYDDGRKIACTIMSKLFKQYRAINVIVMFAKSSTTYEIFTGNPYGDEGEICEGSSKKSKCGEMKIVSISDCENGSMKNMPKLEKWVNKKKISRKLKSDCIFNFCARVQEPFINENCRDGLEIEVMKFLQNEIGFNLNASCYNMDRGELLENGSWSDLLGKVK